MSYICIISMYYCIYQIREATRKIAKKFNITGPMNMQFLVKDNDVLVRIQQLNISVLTENVVTRPNCSLSH